MYINERHNKIIEFVNQQKSVSVKELSKMLDYSSATIRSDLNFLDEQGDLIRTHGGAVAKESRQSSVNFIENYESRKLRNRIEKNQIAEEAFSLIEDSMAIVLDASSTCYQLAKLIDTSDLRLTILTNGLEVAQLLKDNPNITMILIGGILKGKSNSVEGLLGVDVLHKLNVDCAFVSAQGFDLKNGLTDFNMYEVELKREFVKKAENVYALIDHTKFDKPSVASFASINQIDLLITDDKVDEEIINNYKAEELNLVVTSGIGKPINQLL